MDEVKTLGFDWEFGHEELALEVASYANNGCLYIGLHNKTEEGFEQFGDLTVNLPMSSMIPPEPNEAYIDNFSSTGAVADAAADLQGRALAAGAAEIGRAHV